MTKRILLPLLSALIFQSAFAQLNITLQSHYAFGTGVTCANLASYAKNGHEYALVGNSDGLSIIEVTNPATPNLLFTMAATNSFWREVAVYQDYAYVTNEDGGGLQIVDLAGLPATCTQTFFTSGDLATAHTVFVDENGICYLFGYNTNAGIGQSQRGAMILDLNTSLTNPNIVGYLHSGYIHDGYVHGDTLYAAQVYDGFFQIYDMSTITAPVILAAQNTPDNFTHNVAITPDRHYLFSTDEVTNSNLTAYDISNLSNITELDRAQSNPGSGVIVHNTYWLNGFLPTSYYKDGVTIFDATYPDNMILVGAYDEDPAEAGDGFSGDWGVWPYLPSGTLLVSDIYTGLYVFSPNYVHACWLNGNITDTITHAVLNGVSVQVLTTPNNDLSNLAGDYATGNADSGYFSIRYSKPGYITKIIPGVHLQNGVVTIQNAELYPLTPFVQGGQVIDSVTLAPVPNALVLFQDSIFTFLDTTDAGGNFSFPAFYQGNYQVFAGRWGYLTKGIPSMSINSTFGPVTIKLNKGYYDDFIFNFNWIASGTAPTGVWERGEPIGTTQASNPVNPDVDVVNDFGDQCYVTGNGGGSASTDDVDNGSAILTSPSMDLTTYSDPIISYDRWFANTGGGSAPNDTFRIRLHDGTNTTEVETITIGGTTPHAWVHHQFHVNAFMTPTSNMTMEFYTADQAATGHLVEAALDKFMVTDSVHVGIAESEKNPAEVFPNPAGESFSISGLTNEMRSGDLEIVDQFGRVVMKYPLAKSSFDIQSLADGIYFLRINQTFISPLVKIKN